MSQAKTGYLYKCKQCPFTSPKYLVKRHFMEKHIPLKEVPYLCVPCGKKLGTKQQADRHAHSHEGEFRDIFSGTYKDWVADPPMSRVLEVAKENKAPKSSSCQEPEGDRTEELKRLMTPRSPAVCTPPMKKRALSVISNTEIDVAPGGAIDPPILDTMEELVKISRLTQVSLKEMAVTQTCLLAYVRRCTHALEALRPPPPPPTTTQYRPPRHNQNAKYGERC